MTEIKGLHSSPRRTVLALPAPTDTVTPLTSPRKKTDTLRERENVTVAQLLSRFMNLIALSTLPVEEGATKEVAAAQVFEIEIESSALVSS